MRLAQVVVYGEMGRVQMDVVPLTIGDPILSVWYLSYNCHIYDEDDDTPFETRHAGQARAIVKDGTNCNKDHCFSSSGEGSRQDVQAMYEESIFNKDDLQDCTIIAPKRSCP